jgi:hypothetical protein
MSLNKSSSPWAQCLNVDSLVLFACLECHCITLPLERGRSIWYGNKAVGWITSGSISKSSILPLWLNKSPNEGAKRACLSGLKWRECEVSHILLVTLPNEWIYMAWTSTVLTLILLTWRIWWAPNNASNWQKGFNLAFKMFTFFIV